MSNKAQATVKAAPVESTEVAAQTEIVTNAPKQELSTETAQPLSFSSSDLEIPRLNIVQKMSEIDGPLGSIVVDKEDVIAEAGDKLKVIVLGAVKRFKEDVPYDDDYTPKMASTEEEAKALAKDSSYEIIEFAEIVLLIPQTGADESAFPYEIAGTNYQLGRITVQKDAYRMTYKRLFTFHKVNRGLVDISSIYWSFSSEPFSKGKYSWYVPMLASTKEAVPQEVLEFADSLKD